MNNVYKGMVNNAQGRLFEERIIAACEYYRIRKKAVIHKTPESFLCLKKSNTTKTFTGRFTAKAQPDFCGTLFGGKSIVFECKYTTADRIRKTVLTPTQMEVLRQSEDIGAQAYVCFGIQDKTFFMPFRIWDNMEKIFGYKYLMPGWIKEYEVRQGLNCTLFLDKEI